MLSSKVWIIFASKRILKYIINKSLNFIREMFYCNFVILMKKVSKL